MLEMTQHRPEERFSKLRAALLVGVGETVPGWRGDSEAGQNTRLEAQPVANLVESHSVGELGEEHRAKMAPRAEGASFGFHARGKGEAVNHSARNEVEYLLEDDHIGAGWYSFVHTPYRVAGISTQHHPAFSLQLMPSCGGFESY